MSILEFAQTEPENWHAIVTMIDSVYITAVSTIARSKRVVVEDDEWRIRMFV